jgi:hypothetical protein
MGLPNGIYSVSVRRCGRGKSSPQQAAISSPNLHVPDTQGPLHTAPKIGRAALPVGLYRVVTVKCGGNFPMGRAILARIDGLQHPHPPAGARIGRKQPTRKPAEPFQGKEALHGAQLRRDLVITGEVVAKPAGTVEDAAREHIEAQAAQSVMEQYPLDPMRVAEHQCGARKCSQIEQVGARYVSPPGRNGEHARVAIGTPENKRSIGWLPWTFGESATPRWMAIRHPHPGS